MIRRNITYYKDKSFIVPLYKNIVYRHGVHISGKQRSARKNKRRATKLIPGLRDLR